MKISLVIEGKQEDIELTEALLAAVPAGNRTAFIARELEPHIEHLLSALEMSGAGDG